MLYSPYRAKPSGPKGVPFWGQDHNHPQTLILNGTDCRFQSTATLKINQEKPTPLRYKHLGLAGLG
jgi:hypothetical protein